MFMVGQPDDLVMVGKAGGVPASGSPHAAAAPEACFPAPLCTAATPLPPVQRSPQTHHSHDMNIFGCGMLEPNR